MKECVCFCDWQVNGTVSLPRPPFLHFPTPFRPNLLPAFSFLRCNSHVSSAANASANIWVNFCRRDWERCVGALRTVILTSQTLTLCLALVKIYRVRWCGSGSRKWTWWHLDAAKHQQIHAYSNGCKKHSGITFYKYNCRAEISEKNMMFYSGLIVRSPKSPKNSIQFLKEKNGLETITKSFTWNIGGKKPCIFMNADKTVLLITKI